MPKGGYGRLRARSPFEYEVRRISYRLRTLWTRAHDMSRVETVLTNHRNDFIEYRKKARAELRDCCARLTAAIKLLDDFSPRMWDPRLRRWVKPNAKLLEDRNRTRRLNDLVYLLSDWNEAESNPHAQVSFEGVARESMIRAALGLTEHDELPREFELEKHPLFLEAAKRADEEFLAKQSAQREFEASYHHRTPAPPRPFLLFPARSALRKRKGDAAEARWRKAQHREQAKLKLVKP